MLNALLLRSKNLLIHHSYIPTEYLILDEKKLIYIPIPKVACTSIKLALFSEPENGTRDYKQYMEIHSLSGKSSFYTLTKQQKKYYIFAFVRNPLDRLVSCYEDKVRSETQHNGKYFFNTNYNNVFIKRMYGDKFRKEMTFDEFVGLVSKIPDAFSDGHFKSQASMLYRRGIKNPDYIGKFENLANDWQVLRKQYDCGFIEESNSTKHDNWKQYYTNPKTTELAIKRYMSDITKFGYKGDCSNLY